MSDSNIHDSGFAGSPIVSYGQASVRNRIPKLLAFVAGSFAVALALLCLWFWFFTSLPIPTNAVVLTVVPASVELPVGSPEVWKSAQKNNSPLSTVLGYVKLSDDSNQERKDPVPFAVNVFSLSDLFGQGKTAVWKLQTIEGEASLIAVERQSPWHLMGFPAKGRGIWLKIWPKRLLASADSQLDVPETLGGYYQGGVWTVEDLGFGQNPYPFEQRNNFVQIFGAASDYLANFAAAQGLQIRMPSSSFVGWGANDEGLRLTISPADASPTSVALGLTQDKKLIGKSRRLLGDQTVYDEYVRLNDTNLSITTTADGSFHYDLNPAIVVSPLNPNQSESQVTCPGDELASFDQVSVRNLCSWIGICFDYPQNLVISRKDDNWNFCIHW
ncbi:MAG: hypothetical protein PHS79_05825 [Patescibacteria group bacterium]|nr:hypothetical protein [Patescibacteria group bacterium]